MRWEQNAAWPGLSDDSGRLYYAYSMIQQIIVLDVANTTPEFKD